MRRLVPCLILAIIFAQPAGAKTIICSWQNVVGGNRDFTCQTAPEHGLPNVGVHVDDLTPTPEIVRLVARTVRGSEIDPRLVLAVIGAESAFDSQAVSPKNAMGLMQLMPETVARFGVRNPFDAEENVRAGASYLLFLLKKYRNLELALAAYNAGEGPVLSYGTVPPYEETTEYIVRVLRLYQRYQGIAFDRSEPVKVVATAAPAKAKGVPPAASTRAKVVPTAASTRAKAVGSCGLICRGNMLAARLDDIERRMPVSQSHPDASGFGSASDLSARAN